MNSLYCYILFLVIFVSQKKEYIIWRISFSKSSGVLSDFTCASAAGNLWIIYLGVDVLRLKQSETLATRARMPGQPVPLLGCIEQILFLKTLKTISLHSKSTVKVLRIFPLFFSLSLGIMFCYASNSYAKSHWLLSKSFKVFLPKYFSSKRSFCFKLLKIIYVLICFINWSFSIC